MKKIKPFNLYYLNLSKVYEISMMINNVILTSVNTEEGIAKEKESSLSVNYGSEIGKKDLAKIKAGLSYEEIDKQTYSSKISRTFEVKTTKSRLLLDILKRCETVKGFDPNEKLDRGALIKVDNLRLNLFNEKNTRAILALRKNALDGFQHEGLNVNNLINSIVQDYTFVVRGELENNKQYLIFRIPTSLENEFENQYTIDDLLIGRVSIVGIYRGEETKKSIESNTITFFQNASTTESHQEGVVSGNRTETTEIDANETKYHYVDILAITQDIRFHFELNGWEKLLKWLKRLWKKG